MGEQIISASGEQFGMIVNSDGSINISGTVTSSVTVGSVSTYGIGSVLVTNPTEIGSLSKYNSVMYGSSGTDVGIYPIRVVSGTTAALIVTQSSSTRTVSAGSFVTLNSTGSIPVYSPSTLNVSGNVLVSGTVTANQGTNPWIVLGSTQITNPATVGSLATQTIIGSVAITNTGSVIQGTSPWVVSGNILVSGTVAVTQSTNPWIVLGSTQVTNPSTVGSLSLYKSSLYGSSGTDAGIYPLAVTSGTNGNLIVAQGTSPWTILGSVNIDNAVSVGSISTQNISGNVLVSGTVALRGVGSIYGIGVGSVAVAVISPATIGSLATQNVTGSVHVTQSTNPWIVLGSAQITNPTDVGSISVQFIQGRQGNGQPIIGSPVVIGFTDLFGNALIPTGITVGGINVMGVIGIDLNGNLIAYSGGACFVIGDVAHDGADAGNPVKVGVKATDYEPDQSMVYNGSLAEVAENDRANVTSNRWGQIVEGVNPFYASLGSLNTIYQSGLTFTSTVFESWNYRQASFSYELFKSGNPTDMLFEVEGSLDGTNYAVMQNDFLGDLRESAASVNAGSGIKKTVTFPIACQKIRVKSKATGVSGTNHFIISGATLYMRN